MQKVGAVHQFMFSGSHVFHDRSVITTLMCCNSYFLFICAPGGEIVAPPPIWRRCDTPGELEDHYYIVPFKHNFTAASFKPESCFG